MRALPRNAPTVRKSSGVGGAGHVTRFFTTEDTESTEFWIARAGNRLVLPAADENETPLHVSSPSLLVGYLPPAN